MKYDPTAELIQMIGGLPLKFKFIVPILVQNLDPPLRVFVLACAENRAMQYCEKLLCVEQDRTIHQTASGGYAPEIKPSDSRPRMMYVIFIFFIASAYEFVVCINVGCSFVQAFVFMRPSCTTSIRS